MEMNKEEEFDLELKKLEEEIDKRDLVIALLTEENERQRMINREMKQQLDIATDLGEKRFREIERLLILNKELKQQLDAAYEYDFNTF